MENTQLDINDISLQPIPKAVQVIKTAILQSQERTTRNVNADLIALNYAVGGYVSENTRNKVWGSGAIMQISEQLQKELPGLKGFSESSIKNMRQFYEEWNTIIFRQPSAGEIENVENENNTNRQPLAGENETLALSVIPFSRLHFEPQIFDV